MNNRNEDEKRGAPNWLSELARVYGAWHLAVTILQGIAWACLVTWTESGSHQHWSHTLRAVGSLVWPALPAFWITSMAILAVAQKGGRIVLTFIDERRQRLRKVREEGREEGRTEGREEGREEVIDALSLDPRIAALLRDDPKIRQTLRERGIELPDERNGDD